MSLYSLRRQIHSLKRRLPIHYKLAFLRPIAQQFCDDWEYAVGMGYEPPTFFPHSSISASPAVFPPRKSSVKPFMDRIRGAGIYPEDWMNVKNYLDDCRDRRIYPHPNDILRTALPRAAYLHLIPASPYPITYPIFGREQSFPENDSVSHSEQSQEAPSREEEHLS